MIEQSIFRDVNCRNIIIEIAQVSMQRSIRSAAEEEGDDLVKENTKLTKIGITICKDGTKNFWVSMAPLVSYSSARLSPKIFTTNIHFIGITLQILEFKLKKKIFHRFHTW